MGVIPITVLIILDLAIFSVKSSVIIIFFSMGVIPITVLIWNWLSPV